jgi:hypothetical protein
MKIKINDQLSIDYFKMEPWRADSPVFVKRWRIPWNVLGFWMTMHVREDTFNWPMPKRFGIAIRDWDRDATYYFVCPLNVIIALVRWVYYQAMYTTPNKLSTDEVVLDSQVWMLMDQISQHYIDRAAGFIQSHEGLDGEFYMERK